MTDIAILQADARRIPLASETVQCIVTSPPYWGLRKYAGEQGEEPYGLEPTIEAYIAHTVEILRECRRVLRKDGVCFWNVGDSYHSARGYGGDLKPSHLQSSNRGSLRGKDTYCPNRFPQSGLKPKDLCLIPARVALAAQADGWWVRSLIIWAKPNPMPESCQDRPTDAYEHIILLAKSERYFWDADAVRETSQNTSANHDSSGLRPGHDERDGKERFCSSTGGYVPPGGRNLRNVWTFPTQPYPGAHFATFPEEIPRRAILAGTSAAGACMQCGAPWRRVIRSSGGTIGKSYIPHTSDEETGKMPSVELRNQMLDGTYRRDTIGWRPGCRCRGQHGRTRPCLVLDPFGGSGTTGRVAAELNRRAVLLDLAYHDHQQQRTRGVQRMLAGLV